MVRLSAAAEICIRNERAIIRIRMAQLLEPIRWKIDRPDNLLVPRDCEAIGHAGDEISEGPKLLHLVSGAPPVGREERRIVTVCSGEIGDDALGFVPDGP